MADDVAPVNHETRKDVAVLSAQMQALTREVRAYREEDLARGERHERLRKEHSQRLDKIELTLARMESAKAKADKACEEIEQLRKEQRWWTGAASLVAALGNFDIGALFR